MMHRLPEDGGEQEGRWTGGHTGMDSNQRPGVHHQADGMSPDSLVPCATHARTHTLCVLHKMDSMTNLGEKHGGGKYVCITGNTCSTAC